MRAQADFLDPGPLPGATGSNCCRIFFRLLPLLASPRIPRKMPQDSSGARYTREEALRFSSLESYIDRYKIELFR